MQNAGRDHLSLRCLAGVLDTGARVAERIRPPAGAKLRLGQVQTGDDLELLQPVLGGEQELLLEKLFGLIERERGDAGARERCPWWNHRAHGSVPQLDRPSGGRRDPVAEHALCEAAHRQ